MTEIAVKTLSHEGFLVDRPVSVIAAKREHWTNRISPKAIKSRSALEGKIQKALNDHAALRKNTQVDLVPSPESAAQTIDSEIATAWNMVKGLETRTLKMIVEATISDDGCPELFTLLQRYRYEAEHSLRETIFYSENMVGLSVEPRKAAFNDVRVSHPSFMLEDLSELTGEYQVAAEAAIALTLLLSKNDAHPYEWHGYIHKRYLDQGMVSALLETPDRVMDIFDYVQANPAPTDHERLRYYLDNPSSSLANGVL